MKIPYIPKNFRPESIAMIERCNSVIDDFQRQGYTPTLRQLYYQLVKANAIPNNDKSYSRIGDLVTDARLAGEIDWDAIEDRHRSNNGVYCSEEGVEGIMKGLPYHLVLDKWEDQRYHVEVWVEKDALSNIVSRAASRMNVGWMACKGYLSASMMHACSERFVRMIEEEGKQPVIIHLGDHDPSGKDMTRDNAERLNRFIEYHLGGGEGVHVERIALNIDQVRANHLPPNPAKLSDSRSESYVAEFGRDSWELDALSPNQLESLIIDAVRPFRDEEKWQARFQEQTRQRAILSGIGENFSTLEDAAEKYNEGNYEDANDEFLNFGQAVAERVTEDNDGSEFDEEE